MTASQCTDHHQIPPWALFGGKVGSLGATLIDRAGAGTWTSIKDAFGKVSSSKYARITVREGDRVRIIVPGGGGFGDPHERDRALVEEDVREGFVSPGSAENDYGLAFPSGRSG
jgi:N-methylhydantoinase B